MDAVEVEGDRPPGELENRPGNPRADLPRGPGPVQEGRRPWRRTRPERHVELHEPGGTRPRRSAEGDQREGDHRHSGPEGQDEDDPYGGAAAREVRAAPGRRLHALRNLAAPDQ